MKRYASAVLVMLFATLAVMPAHAALRVPQIAFDSAQLATQFALQGESIDLLNQQQDGLVWGSTVSTNSTMTIQFELTGPLHQNTMGIAILDATGKTVIGHAPVFPAGAAAGTFAVASFRPGNQLVVNLFDVNATILGRTTFSNVNRNLFAYYLENGPVRYYSHEGFNADGKVHALAYAGTGENKGCWWMAWEDAEFPDYADAQYDDALLFLESLNPTPVNHASWGKVKSLFR